ncbi:MAG: sortase, partial [Chloroflexota bacterium]
VGCTPLDAGSVLNVDPVLFPLGDYGGDTMTHAIIHTSPAYDASGTGATDEDQRDIAKVDTRDLGAFEFEPLYVTFTTPEDDSIQEDVTEIDVTYNHEVLHDGSLDAANNKANYLLVEWGANSSFDTKSCEVGWQSDDTNITINSVSFDAGSQTATLAVNNGVPLPGGEYRLFVCGTTSVTDLMTAKLNNGESDTIVDFTILAEEDLPIKLPATGFAPGQITQLPSQPAELAYTAVDIVLEIPSLGVSMPVVGVPLDNGEWNTSWLGDAAGWLSGTSFPTWAGNTVLTGHVWNSFNNPGPFNKLKDLQHGDQFLIHAFGSVYTYEVRDSQQVYASDLSVLKHSDYDTVTLLTCESYSLWSGAYRYRRAVSAALVSVE